MKELIIVNINPDHNAESGVKVLGREGESNTSRLEICIPEALRVYDIYIDFEKPSGETVRTSRLEVADGVAHFDIPLYLLSESGEIKIQVVFQKENEVIWKSSVKTYTIQESINAVADIPNKEDFITKAQKILDAFGGELNKMADVLSQDADFISKIAEKVGTGFTDEQLEQFNALVKWYNQSTYKSMTVSISPEVSNFEICDTANPANVKTINFTWNFSHDVSSVTFNGKSQTPAKSGSASVTGITSSGSYVVSGIRKDGDKEEKSATANVYFYNKYYFGCASPPTDAEDISTFIKEKLTYRTGWAGSKPSLNEKPTLRAGEYIWYAYPKRLGASAFQMNGFNGGFKEAEIVSFTNGSGYTEEYYLYRSIETGTGSIGIQTH